MWRLGFTILACSSFCTAATISETNAQNRTALTGVRLTSKVHLVRVQPPRLPNLDIPEVVLRAIHENPEYDIEEVKIIDFAQDQMLYDSRDLRDMSILTRKYGLTEQETTQVDKSLGWVSIKHKTVLWWPSSQNFLKRGHSAIGPSVDDAFRRDEELFFLGVVSDRMLENATVQGTVVQVDRIILVFDPGVGNHLIKATFSDGDGKPVKQCTLSDYRLIGQAWIPFKQEEIAGANVTVRTVLKAETKPIEKDLIRIPTEYIKGGSATTRPYGWDDQP